jgi:hypothetical protein
MRRVCRMLGLLGIRMAKTPMPHSCAVSGKYWDGKAKKKKPLDPRFVNGARVALSGQKATVILPDGGARFGDVGLRFDEQPYKMDVAGMWQAWLLEQDDFEFLDEPIAARHRPRKKRAGG